MLRAAKGPRRGSGRLSPGRMMAKSNDGGRDHRDQSASIKERLARLGTQLGNAQARHRPPSQPAQRGSALGLAFRIAAELIAGVAVGAFVGWWLDWLLGTSPFLLLIFFALGAAAGILNVMRTARAMQAGSGAGTGRDLPDTDDD